MQRFIPATCLLACLALACLALAFGAYFPGTSGYFLFDDTINIVDNISIRLQTLDLPALKEAALSGDAGMLGRPLSMLSFALNYYFNGLNPFNFKLTNIVIHLLNGVCIYALTVLILQTCRQRDLSGINEAYARWVGLAVASAWLLHPLNLTAVLYIVQRMTSLAALFTLMGLITYLRGRQQLAVGKSGWGWIVVSFALFMPLAVFSKENGALLPVFMLAIEWVFFRFKTATSGSRRFLIALFTISILLPLIALMTYFIANPASLISGYSVRDFTLTERLMTEARVMWFYIQLIAAPDISQLGVYHDDISVSKSLLTPPSTVFSCIGIILLTGSALILRKRHPIASFGILFFLIGHSLESSVIALELVHEHRNYLPAYGLLLTLFYYLLYPLAHAKSLKARQILAVFFTLMLAGVTFLRATQWGDHFLMKEMAAANHPNSIRSNVDIGALYSAMPALSQEEADEYYRRAFDHFKRAASLSPTDTLGTFGLIDLNSKHQLPIDEAWVQDLAGRIERYPFLPNTANSLIRLERCMIGGDCILSPETMETLFQAAFRNPTLQGKAKTQILFAWSEFLFRVRQDRDAAAKAAYAAAANFPNNIKDRLVLIRILTDLGRTDEAQIQLEQTRLLDKTEMYSTTLTNLEELLTPLSQKSN